MKKIAVVTATRAEYGLLRPLILRIQQEAELELQLLVTGTHLSDQYGNTQDEIIQDNLTIYRTFEILTDGNTPYDISCTMANALVKFAKYFSSEKPDLLLVLGDRTEMLSICCAAMNEQIPIAHLHGGELTEGAVDDCVRHAITKMSFLHFPCTEIYRNRIIQLGECPDRVFNVGALGVENILNLPLLDRDILCREAGIPEKVPYVVVTFHPVTTEGKSTEKQICELLAAMKEENFFYLITKANADAGGKMINSYWERFAEECENVRLVASLGAVRYLSAVKYAAFVLGNSSSGIIEAPTLGTPTVNIGNRQKGRMMADSVITCDTARDDITAAMHLAACMEHKKTNLFGDGNTSMKILKIIKKFLFVQDSRPVKKFYDIGRSYEKYCNYSGEKRLKGTEG